MTRDMDGIWLCHRLGQVQNDGPRHPVDSRLRGNDEDGRGNDGMFYKGIHEWRGGRCCVSFSPSDPVSGTGTGSSIPLPSREREIGWFVLLYASPCGYCLKASMTGLSVVLSCFTLTLVLSLEGRGGFGRLCCLVVNPTLWIPAYAERACATVVSSRYSAWRVPSAPLDCGSSPQ